jgi:tryptophanyl-tRNA synthetase
MEDIRKKTFQDIVVSGTRPTGNLHLGNYLGAVKQYVVLQDKIESYFFIADLHSLTTHPNPTDFSNNILTVLVEYLACGLDPEKTTIYLQSDIPQIPELYLYLNMHAYLGELERVPTFKDKARAHPDNINVGLLTYPTLMAADILIHKGTKVPVGKDQEQHLEMTRLFARRFNNVYKTEVFPESQAYNFGNELIKVPSLNGEGKMSKSDDPNSCIFLKDSEADILKKCKKAKTDSGPTGQNQPLTDSVKNIFTLMEHVSSQDTINFFMAEYSNATIRYGDMKAQLAKDMNTYLSPIREKMDDLYADKVYTNKVIKTGAEKAIESATKTIKEVKETIGFYKVY